MKTYKATFIGRKLLADGIFYRIEDTVTAENKESARLKLYEKWDHIRDLKLEEIDQQGLEQ